MLNVLQIQKPERKKQLCIRVKPSTTEILKAAASGNNTTASFIASEILDAWAKEYQDGKKKRCR